MTRSQRVCQFEDSSGAEDGATELRAGLTALAKATGLGLSLRVADDSSPDGLETSLQNPLCRVLAGSGLCSWAVNAPAPAALLGDLARKSDGPAGRARPCRAGMMHVDLPVLAAGRIVGWLAVGQVFVEPLSGNGFAGWWRGLSRTIRPGSQSDVERLYHATPGMGSERWHACLNLVAHLATGWGRALAAVRTHRECLETDPVSRAQEFARQHLAEPLTSRCAARHVGLCQAHFCRRFRRQTGCTFTQFVAAERIKRARVLLRESPARITEVAFAAGFQSLWQFNRAFRRQVGMSPSAARRTARSVAHPELAPCPGPA